MKITLRKTNYYTVAWKGFIASEDEEHRAHSDDRKGRVWKVGWVDKGLLFPKRLGG